MSHDSPATCARLPDGKLLEGIVTTLNDDRSPHIAPMGPIVDVNFRCLLVRPFCTSQTYRNLKRAKEGVFHVTDDVELFAKAAVGQLTEIPPLQPAAEIDGLVLADACRWYEFRVRSIDDREDRTEIMGDVVAAGTGRDFFGFNRAKHAVIEAAILATRIELLEHNHILEQFERMTAPVEKTGGHEERRAFAFLKRYVEDRIGHKIAEKSSP